MFALVDCNNFYASCERVFNPKIENKPVIVLSNNDGCVIARSNESKVLGVKMGEPAFKLKNIIEKYNINVFSTNFALYGDFSKRVMNVLRIRTIIEYIQQIDFTKTAKGVYFLEIETKNGVINKKLILQ